MQQQQQAPPHNYPPPAANSAAFDPQPPPSFAEVELEHRAWWRRVAIQVCVLGVVFILLGAMLAGDRNNIDSGACCIPKECNVENLQKIRPFSTTPHSAACNFTREEVRMMGCLNVGDAFTPRCTIKNSRGCSHDQAKVFISGAFIPQLIAGIILIIIAAAFFANGQDCYGSPFDKKKCCNYCAMVTTVTFWLLVFAAAIVSLVFVSMLIHFYRYPARTFRVGCDPTVKDEHSDGYCRRNSNNQDKKNGDTVAPEWSGTQCPLRGRVAYTFNFIHEITRMQRFDAYFVLANCVAFLCVCIYVLAIACRHVCCKSKSNRRRHGLEGYDPSPNTVGSSTQPQQQQGSYTPSEMYPPVPPQHGPHHGYYENPYNTPPPPPVTGVVLDPYQQQQQQQQQPPPHQQQQQQHMASDAAGRPTKTV